LPAAVGPERCKQRGSKAAQARARARLRREVAPVRRATEEEHSSGDREYGNDFGRSQERLDPPSQQNTRAVDDGEQRDDAHGDDLPHAQLKGVGGAERVQRALEPNTVKPVDVCQEDGDRGTVSRDARSTDEKAVEHIQKSRHLAKSGAQVDILTTGLRQQRSQLGETQGAEDGNDACHDPRGEHQGRGADRLCHDGGLEENARADGDPDDQRSCVNERQPAAGLEE